MSVFLNYFKELTLFNEHSEIHNEKRNKNYKKIINSVQSCCSCLSLTMICHISITLVFIPV